MLLGGDRAFVREVATMTPKDGDDRTHHIAESREVGGRRVGGSG
jgi:hypothetical protein